MSNERATTMFAAARRGGVLRWLMAGLCALTIAADAGATQHLVEPGKDWSKLVPMIRPGDEVLLMPGNHTSVTLRDLKGTPEDPITVRGIDRRRPIALHGPETVLTLINPENVIFENFAIEDCAMTAVVIRREPAEGAEPSTPAKRKPGPVVLRDFTVRRVGPDEDARTVIIRNMAKVTLERWTFESWSGRALEVFDSSDITIRSCTFTGDDEYAPELAALVYGGSSDVTVEYCRFEDAGHTTAVMFGGRTEPQLLVDRAEQPGSAAPIAEATGCRVSDCVFIDQACPVVLAHADRCAIRYCTFVRPKRYVFALLSMHGDDDRFMAARRPMFTSNLVTWTAGELTGVALIDAANREVKLRLQSNLWWSNEPAELRRRMIPTVVEEPWPQEVELDPSLDEHYRPKSDEAAMFGAREP